VKKGDISRRVKKSIRNRTGEKRRNLGISDTSRGEGIQSKRRIEKKQIQDER